MANPLERAIEKFPGGLQAFADSFPVKYQAVQRWRRKGRVPPERVVKAAELLGLQLWELNDAVYPESVFGKSLPQPGTARKCAG